MTRAASFALAVALAGACHRAPRCPERLALDAPPEPVGFDAPFAVAARTLCGAPRAGTITWRQLAGPSVALAPADDGFTVRARTPTLATSLGGPPPWGVVPLSPRTRGELLLEAIWRDGRGAEERHEVRVAAAARARGLPSTSVDARVYLGGAGWRLDARPSGAAATLETSRGVTSVRPDVAGDWRLTDGGGRALTLRAGRYDETPLDCGRPECHASVAAASAASPMTTVFARGLAPAGDGHRAAFGDAYPGCALGCHTTGEPGVADGGFAHVMNELGVATLGARRWDDVPRPLRRLGGVGCLACHGPGALPEASARWSILRADVCATCHDAPARYGHVAAWRTTDMARADRDARASTDETCARCHTTWGFLAQASPEAARVDRRPPAGVGPVGVTCAACHAVHEHGAGHAPGPTRALLRAAPRPALLVGATLPAPVDGSAICLGCHAPEPTDDAPAASAAALWLGRGGLDPRTGAALAGPTPHASIVGGCVGCHDAGPRDVARGAGHAFVAGTTTCARCHDRAFPADALRADARALWSALRARTGAAPDAGGAPPHARAARLDRATPLGRAAWDVSLVLEDPAAAA
ncbi:MAG TPA: hypothetical protein VLA14_11700, partial [Polyangia bacterium]|nr:hypothetical protein [Polyangia bacterium]